ncbi:MAG: hypothetical protein HOE11_02905 [Candidatus Diapherotrites archaeon]|nr:hypothetical protein [Candidatus Diapherotrites archaeon]MBT4596883.1 hypothetical protein [Candidatus Diapherotrites archaeon]
MKKAILVITILVIGMLLFGCTEEPQPILKEEALQIAQANSSCKISTQTDILDFINLVAEVKEDYYLDTPIEEGLFWEIPTTTCENKCYVNAITRELITIEITCEY